MRAVAQADGDPGPDPPELPLVTVLEQILAPLFQPRRANLARLERELAGRYPEGGR